MSGPHCDTKTIIDCEVCPDKPGDGWKLPGVTHCRECHATWRMTSNSNHCVTCHLTFGSISAGYRFHTDAGHPHPATAGLVAFTNQWGTEEWTTEAGAEERTARAGHWGGKTH